MWAGLRFAAQQILVQARPVLQRVAKRQYERQALRERQVQRQLEARRLRDVQALAERQPAVVC
jgi:hypothetical protein